jgi:hypothetical protein
VARRLFGEVQRPSVVVRRGREHVIQFILQPAAEANITGFTKMVYQGFK